jgi:hypothetical protein
LKRRSAGDAKELRIERLGRAQAPPANRIAKYFAQIFAADTAGVGEKEGKKSAGDGSYYRGTWLRDCG